MTESAKILIVEDDANMVELLKLSLRRMNYKIAGQASSGSEAVKLAVKLCPDLVIMDIELENDFDGIETAIKIRETCSIPVVYLTAHEDELLFQRAKATEPFGYLIKPFVENDLRIVLEIALYKDSQEKKIKTMQEYTRNIIDCSMDMIIAVNNKRRIIEFNKTAEETFGYSRGEVLGKHINLLYADKKRGLSIHKKTLKNNRCIQEILNRHKSGKTFPSLLASSILHDSQGKEIGVMGISRDVTELKKTTEALKTSREYAKNIIDSSLDMIIAVDKKRKITEFNKAAENTFGYSRDEVIGNTIDMLYVQSRKGDHVHKIAIQEGSYSQEILNKKKNGKIFPAILSASVLRDEKGEVMGVMGVSRDITEIKQAREKLKKSEEKYRRLSTELYEANSMKELLLDIITHDLKNPLGVISGLAELMNEESPDNEMLNSIKNCSDRLMKVIDNATTLSKVSLGEEIEVEELDLVEVLKAIALEFASQLTLAEMSLELKLPDTLPIMANPIIEEVFKNYISNAIKYASDGHKIIVTEKRENGFITVCIKDLGTVIPANKRKSVFKRRIQLEKKGKGGTGLGLAIVKRIAGAHKGDVWVEPNKPLGNIFCIRLPNLIS